MKTDSEKFGALKNRFNGQVILPGESGYNESRAIWNAMFNKKPAAIIKCHEAEDVAEAVKFGKENNLLIAIKGGGHNSAGTAVCDNGLMIDFSVMKWATWTVCWTAISIRFSRPTCSGKGSEIE